MLGVSFFVFLVCHTSDYHTALFLMTMALTCNAFHTSAICVIPQDIAPKYSGSVYGESSENTYLEYFCYLFFCNGKNVWTWHRFHFKRVIWVNKDCSNIEFVNHQWCKKNTMIISTPDMWTWVHTLCRKNIYISFTHFRYNEHSWINHRLVVEW